MQAWLLLGQLLHGGGGGEFTQSHALGQAQSGALLGAQSPSHRTEGVPQLSFSLFKVFHSCWAMICGEAWLSLIPAPLALQTAGRQTAG